MHRLKPRRHGKKAVNGFDDLNPDTADIITVNNLGGQLPDMTTFITYLETEAEFMEGNMTDYGSAAGYIKRKIP